jgi:molybdenum cofactor guanylyltransferase
VEGPDHEIAGIILAGGLSRRMGGRTKALLEIGGKPIIQRVVSALGAVFEKIIVITNRPEEYAFLKLPLFKDIRPGCGSLGGLYTGLSVCGCRRGFLVACDMPFLDATVIKYMTKFAADADVVVPRIRGHLEPLHAIYSRECLPHVESLLDQGDLKILNFLDKVKVLEIREDELAEFDPSLKFIANVNYPEDLDRLQRLELQESPSE